MRTKVCVRWSSGFEDFDVRAELRLGDPNVEGSAMPSEVIKSKLSYSRPEAAAALGISVRTLDRLIANKELRVRRIGSRVLIPVDVVEECGKRDHKTDPSHPNGLPRSNGLCRLTCKGVELRPLGGRQ